MLGGGGSLVQPGVGASITGPLGWSSPGPLGLCTLEKLKHLFLLLVQKGQVHKPQSSTRARGPWDPVRSPQSGSPSLLGDRIQGVVGQSSRPSLALDVSGLSPFLKAPVFLPLSFCPGADGASTASRLWTQSEDQAEGLACLLAAPGFQPTGSPPRACPAPGLAGTEYQVPGLRRCPGDCRASLLTFSVSFPCSLWSLSKPQLQNLLKET